MINLRILFVSLALLCVTVMFGQGAKNIVINEVMTSNTQSIEDEFGQREAWIELANTSYVTYNVRGMYLTTDPRALDESLKAPERIALMSVIPNGDDRTNMQAKQHLLFFCNSDPAKGKLHLRVPINAEDSTMVALYNGNGVELIDKVIVPPLKENESYARINGRWQVMSPDQVTPGHSNKVQVGTDASKVDKFKENDPHGFAMALMAMGIVFLSLVLLWIFFTVFGLVMGHFDTAKKMANKQPIKPIVKTMEMTAEISRKTSNILQEGLDKKGIDMEVYMAVIGMALRQYEDDVHDVESGIITIKPKDTIWDDEYTQMTHFHEPVIPTSHEAPHIPTTPELH